MKERGGGEGGIITWKREGNEATMLLVICNQNHINIHLKLHELDAAMIQLHYLRATVARGRDSEYLHYKMNIFQFRCSNLLHPLDSWAPGGWTALGASSEPLQSTYSKQARNFQLLIEM